MACIVSSARGPLPPITTDQHPTIPNIDIHETKRNQTPYVRIHNLESQLDPDEVVYSSLIQTYLGLLSYENAIFLAERLVAHCPQSENAIYLLAYCHYRNGSPKCARSILLTQWLGRTAAAPRSSSISAFQGSSEKNAAMGSGVELERTRSSARYLLAKCCFDLGLYGEAEEALLRHCREQFARVVSANGGTLGGVKIRGNMNEAMDAWILQATAVRFLSIFLFNKKR